MLRYGVTGRWRLYSKSFDVFVVSITCLIIVAALNAGGADVPSADAEQGYPERFRAFLSEREVVELRDPRVARYVAFVNALSSGDQDADPVADEVDRLYATDAYFSDALVVANGLEQITAHYAGVVESGISTRMTVHDVLEGVEGTYLVWSVDAGFDVLGSAVQSDSIGITLLRFDEEGRITLQQDFWDTTQGVYQHIPLLGSAIKAIQSRFALE